MALPIMEITVQSSAIEEALDRLARSARSLEPAMRDIGGLLEKETDDNFRAQGRPRWRPLSQTTILNRLMGRDGEGNRRGISSILTRDGNLRARARRRLEGGLAILQDTGTLRGSIRASPGRYSVTIGSVLEYAAIHQFGGMAGRGKKVRIPARPFLPVDRDGNLSPEAERGVLAAIYDHLAESI
ncbi:phage virion morphogenesis protein [Desulfovibrio piger]|nr:phage virion morphogenesis protein [Desulfovibrio piger]